MRGDGFLIASSIERIGSSGSYSTRIAFMASNAMSSSRAATAATVSPTNRTLSGQRACSSWLTGRMPKGIGRSRPVSTASTPGIFAAFEVSIRTMRACGTGEPTTRRAPLDATAMEDLLCRLRAGVEPAPGGELHRLEYLDVAGAAAQVAGQRL